MALEFNTIGGVARLVDNPHYVNYKDKKSNRDDEVARMRVVQNNFKKINGQLQKDPVFFTIVYFGVLPDSFKKGLVKGRRISYGGEFNIRTFEKEVKGIKVMVEAVEVKAYHVSPHDDLPAESASSKTLNPIVNDNIPAQGLNDTFGDDMEENVEF